MKHALFIVGCWGLVGCGAPTNNSEVSDKIEGADASNANLALSNADLADDDNVERALKSGASSMVEACGSDSVTEHLLSEVEQEVAPFSDMLFVKAYEPEIPYDITSKDIEAARENLDSPSISAITVRQVTENIGKVECSAALTVSSDAGVRKSYRIEYDLQPMIGESGYLVTSNLDQPRSAWRFAIQSYAKAIAKKRASEAAAKGGGSDTSPLN